MTVPLYAQYMHNIVVLNIVYTSEEDAFIISVIFISYKKPPKNIVLTQIMYGGSYMCI